MEIHQKAYNGVVLLELVGRLDAPAAPDAEREFNELVAAGKTQILLDLTGVEYISSGGIRIIIMLDRACKKEGGELKICGMSPFVRQVFEISNLLQLFEVTGGIEEGLRTFGVKFA